MKRCLGCMEVYEDGYQVCPWCGYVEGTPAEEKIHMDPGMPLHGRYVIGRVLGYGGFGVTYLGWDTVLEQKVAIKEYLPGEFSTRMPGSPTVTVFGGEKSQQFFDGLRKFVDEARRLARFTSEPGVVRIFDSFEENGTAYIVMEYLEGETLKEYLARVGTVSEDEAIRLLTPVMQSLEVIHAEGILHRDIAPDNIFLTNDGEVKLIDFGASRYATTSHSRSLTVIIKPGYSAEEQYRSRGDQGPHTDVYSLGATLYRMITGKTPPDAMERRAKYENQNRDILIPPHVVLKEQKSRQRLSVDRENAILNALNVRIEDRTPDVGTLLSELYSEKPVKRRQGKIKRLDLYTWPLWLKILIPTLLAALVTVGVLLVTGVINLNKYTTVIELPANTVEVPALVNKTSEEARALLSECSLGSSITSIEDENLPVNVVLRQDPPQGAFAAVNSNVNLVVSKGKGAQTAVDGVSTVPYLIGSTKETALADLKTAGLTAEIAEAFSDEFEAGIVMAQSLNAGEQVDEGTKITITVSKGGETFPLPDVTGKAMADADAELKALGLQVVIEQRADANVPVGQVIEQATAAGTPVKKGDSVTLTISSGVPTAAVPNVVGMTEAQANRALANAGFAYAVAGSQYSANAAAGTVLTQNPAANSVQAYGTQINLILSLGAEPVIQPPVTEPPVTEPPVTQPPVTQPPVTQPTATQPQTVSVANVVGKSAGVAQSTLEQQGFNVSTSEEYSDSVPAGTVIRQNPAAGMVLPKGVKITLVVSKGPQINTLTVYFNANGGSVSISNKTSPRNGMFGTLPTPTRDYYFFKGWYTAMTGGTRIMAESTVTGTSDITLFAHWEQKPTSGWSTSVPDGAKITDTKTQYRYRDMQTEYGYEPSRSGWTAEGYEWEESGSGSVEYVVHWSTDPYYSPDRSSPVIAKYNNTISAYENDREKRVITSDTRIGYVYYHWCRGAQLSDGPINRKVCGHKDSEFTTFHAFFTTEDLQLKSFDGYRDAYVSMQRAVCADSYYWVDVRLTINRAYYTDYRMKYVYTRFSDAYSDWQDTAVPGSKTRDVETRTLYKYIEK